MKITECLFRILDTETTGLNNANDKICEVGACDLFTKTPDGVPEWITSTAESLLCNPGIPIPPEARAIHHITDNMVRGKRSPEEAVKEFVADPELAPIVYVAHHMRFDRPFLENAGFPTGRNWLCTWRLAMHVWPLAPSYKNEVLRYWLGFDTLPWEVSENRSSPVHTAGHDVRVTALVLREALQACYGGMFPPNDIESLLAWSEEPVVLKSKLGFGKYFESTWAEVAAQDPGYFDWMIREEDRDPGSWDGDKIHTARHYRGRLI